MCSSDLTNCAVPLGCIAIKRSLGEVVAEQIDRTIQQSLQSAWDQLPGLPDYVRGHAQAMEESVMRQHIDLYVNKHTMNLEEADINAIRTLYKVYLQVEGVNESEAPSLF